MLSAFLASIGYAGGVAVDKILLCKEKFSVRTFIPLLFVLLAILTALLLPVFGTINWGSISWWYIFIFALMIAIACLWNVFYYQGIQKESLHEFELIMLLSPLFTIIFAEIFLPKERNLGIFIAGIIASVVFISSRFKSHHLRLSLVAKKTILAMILLSFESVLISTLLNVFSPVTLYFVRTAVIAIVFYIIYRPKIFKTADNLAGLTLISAAFGVLQMVLKYYGFKELGVVETTMFLLLGPFLVYGFSFFYFHEKNYYKRDIACAAVVIACIVYATVAH